MSIQDIEQGLRQAITAIASTATSDYRNRWSLSSIVINASSSGFQILNRHLMRAISNRAPLSSCTPMYTTPWPKPEITRPNGSFTRSTSSPLPLITS